MSVRHPIISVTGSSGAGTSSVKKTFERIFTREGVKSAFIEGDAFHRYDRAEMKRVMAAEERKGNNHFSHFGLEIILTAPTYVSFKHFLDYRRRTWEESLALTWAPPIRV